MKQLTNLKTKIFIILCFIHLILSTTIFTEIETIPPETEWTVLIISQTKGDFKLHNAFVSRLKAVKELELDEFSKKLNVLIQWETSPEQKDPPRYTIPEELVIFEELEKSPVSTIQQEINTVQHTVPRYKMTKEGLQFIQKVPLTDYPERIVDFVLWGISNYPSKHLAIIFDNHGIGIIDPKPKTPPVKGVLFNLKDKTYLNIQQLGEAMQQIKEILGRKVDLVGFDACLMAAIEVQYQIRDEATFFVASEDVEPGAGWPLSVIFKKLMSRPLTPFELANFIVYAYAAYHQKNHVLLPYHKRYGKFYSQKASRKFTLSAVNLEDIIHLKVNHDKIIKRLQKCPKNYRNVIKKAVENARKECYFFQNPFHKPKPIKPPYVDVSLYVDLSSFYSELRKGLQGLSLSKTKDLKKALTDGIKLIEGIVFANVTGDLATQAKGISIYYPLLFIDESYLKTKFASESLWLVFLKERVKKIGVYLF